MTREIIEDYRKIILPFVKKRLLEINYENLGESDSDEFEKDFNEILDLAAKALEQEPCENAISRLIVQEEISKSIALKENSHQMYKRIQAIPPVTPQQNVGKWMIHPNGVYAHLVCSKCLTNAPYDCKTNYCPNCGAKMEVE